MVAERDGERLEYAPRFILDATGRDTLIAGKLGLKQSNKKNSTRCRLCPLDRRADADDREEPGFISVHLAADGWFWMIPLPGGVMSIGFVGNAEVFKNRSGNVQSLYMERLNGSPSVAARHDRRRAHPRRSIRPAIIPIVRPRPGARAI